MGERGAGVEHATPSAAAPHTAVREGDYDATGAPAHAADDSTPSPDALEHDVESTRAELAVLVDELDRRRHDAMNVPLQVRRHPAAVAVVAAAVLGLVAALWLERRRRRATARERVQNLAHALSLVARRPEKLVAAMERRPDTTTSIISALAKIGGTAGRRAIARAI